MKKLLPSTMLILSMIMFGCSNKPKTVRYMGINGEASQITEFIYREKDELGNILSGEPRSVHIYDFNDMGRTVKISLSSYYYGLESETTCIYERDKCVLTTNRVIKITTSGDIGAPKYKTTKYKLIEIKKGVEKWAIESDDYDEGVFQYTEIKGNLTITSKEYRDGVVKPYCKIKVNKLGYVVEWKTHLIDRIFTEFNEYDFKNQLISKKHRNEYPNEPENTHEQLSIYEYTKHDENGNWIEREEYQDDIMQEIVKREIQYK